MLPGRKAATIWALQSALCHFAPCGSLDVSFHTARVWLHVASKSSSNSAVPLALLEATTKTFDLDRDNY
jgi:hypothetical protein